MARAAASPRCPSRRARSVGVRRSDIDGCSGTGRPKLARGPWIRQAGPPTFAAPSTPRDATHLDNLTHALVGAAISKAGAERATPLATATLVIAANAPDVDLLSYVRDEYFALSFRRGITHGWPALLVLPFVVAAAVLAWDRWIRRARDPSKEAVRARPIVALSAIGVATHPTLDWMNTYGMRWWLPFDSAWSYGDALFIIDPWIWLVLGGAVFLSSRPPVRWLIGWGLLAALCSAVIVFGVGGAVAPLWAVGLAVIVTLRVSRRAVGWRTTAACLAVVSAYIGVLVVADGRARAQVVDAAGRAGIDVRDVMVAPIPGDPFTSEVEVVTDEEILPGTHRWLADPPVMLEPDEAVPLLHAPPDLALVEVRGIVAAARAAPQARDFLVWSRYPYVRVERDGQGYRVRFSDARYDDRAEPGSLAGVTVFVPEGGD